MVCIKINRQINRSEKPPFYETIYRQSGAERCCPYEKLACQPSTHPAHKVPFLLSYPAHTPHTLRPNPDYTCDTPRTHQVCAGCVTGVLIGYP